jgi:hypothetical protein
MLLMAVGPVSSEKFCTAVCHDILENSARVLATSCRRSPVADAAAGHTVGYCVILLKRIIGAPFAVDY